MRTLQSTFIISCFLLFLFILIFPSDFSPVYASDPKDELQKIEKTLQQQKQKVQKTIQKEKSALSELEQLSKILSKKQKELQDYDRRLSKTRSNIRQLENDILLINEKLDASSKMLKERLRRLYKQQHGSIADMLVSAKDNQDLIKKIKYITFIAEHDSNLMKTYSYELKGLNDKIKSMDLLRKELEVNKYNIQKKTDELQAERENKDKLLAAIKSERGSYEKMIKELEDSSEKIREMINKLDEEDVSEPVKGEGFGRLKGRLPWPVYGKILLPFGKQKDPQFNLTTYRKGIEISADPGSAVLAVSDGRVVFADWFKGYGMLTIVNHGSGYHTLYANLSEIFHKSGDIIKVRQSIGRVGESGVLNVPSLYFEIRYKGKPIDPIQWLKKIKE